MTPAVSLFQDNQPQNSMNQGNCPQNNKKYGISSLKKYLLRKTQNIFKTELTDEQAFKWKFTRDKCRRSLSSFQLLKKQQLKQQRKQPNNITLNDLSDFSFPVLAYKTKQLTQFAVMLLKDNQYAKEKFSANQIFLSKLVTQISLNYNIVSYHNFSHAFSLSLMLAQSFQYHQDLNTKFTQEDKFYALIAGLVHDLGHSGTNNAFQVKLGTKLAFQADNQSVLEKYHLRTFWKILDNNPEINFLNKIENSQQIRKKITFLVLGTDVAQHFKNLQKFKILRLQAQSGNKSILDKQQNREFFMGQLFHACDIGNPCVDFQNYITWAALLSYQFNQQTILQKQNNIQITEILRYKDLPHFYKGQLGFINFLVLPLWKEIVTVAGGLQVYLDNIKNNIQQLNYKIVHAKSEDQDIQTTQFL